MFNVDLINQARQELDDRLKKLISICVNMEDGDMKKNTFSRPQIIGIKIKDIELSNLSLCKKEYLINQIRPNIARVERFLSYSNELCEEKLQKLIISYKDAESIDILDIIDSNISIINKKLLLNVIDRALKERVKKMVTEYQSISDKLSMIDKLIW